MSQASMKTTKSLSLTATPNVNKNSPGTAKEKSSSRSSTPATNELEQKQGKVASPKSQRRVSNDSAKVRSSPKAVVILEDTQKKNGHSEAANGTNGTHVDENGKDKKVEDKPEVPKNNKKEKDATAKKQAEKEEKAKPSKVDEANGEEVKTPKSPEKKQKEVLSEKTQPEMESLVIEPEAHADSPMPKSIGKSPGRILKLSQGPPARGARISPFKKASDRLQNASTIVNLSTVSEQSVEAGSATSSPSVSNDSPIVVPQGRISGRRSTRPIKELKLIHQRFNDSNSSMNATVGSPIHNDSLRTPIVAQMIARKRKDGTPEYQDIHADSPSKRARLDFSGFLGYVTTPVTLLKNRLSRVALQSSTPRVLDTEEHIADVSGMETEEIKEDVSQAVEATESTTEKEIENIKSDNVEKSEGSEDTGITVTEHRRRSVCSIM